MEERDISFQEKCLVESHYHYGTVVLKTAQRGELYETQLKGDKIASALFYLSGNTIPRSVRKPTETIYQYSSEASARAGHAQAAALLQHMYGSAVTVTPEQS